MKANPLEIPTRAVSPNGNGKGERLPSPGPPSPRSALGALLLQAGALTAESLEFAQAQQAQTGESLERILLNRGLVSKQALGQILARQKGVPYVDLPSAAIDEELVHSLPDWVISKHRVIPLARVSGDIQLAMVDPNDVLGIDTVGTLLGGRVRPYLTTEQDFDWALTRFFGWREIGEAIPPEEEGDESGETVISLGDDAEADPVVRASNSILDQAVRSRATDVHLEPDGDEAHVRLRIDGILHEKTTLPRSMAAAVTSRLKVLAGLDIAERHRPQDGRIMVRVDGREVDLRIATVGAAFGERTAIRLLDRQQVVLGLDRLGLFPTQQKQLERLLSRPHGMILITGSTGSGKTTTLYAGASRLNVPTRNIITIEDPVEYRLPGITQIPVREKAGITFEEGLRAILRHDPDVVVVGEVRDPQTASIAVHAAMTGHLVLTTLHTNSAATGVIRLVDLGVEPLLLGSALVAVVGQSLLRTLCPACKTSYQAQPAELQLLGAHPEIPLALFRAGGCPECDGRGYKGRTGVFEILLMSGQVRQAILQRLPAAAVAEAARAGGMLPLREAARRKVFEGVTSVEEYERVIQAEGDQDADV